MNTENLFFTIREVLKSMIGLIVYCAIILVAFIMYKTYCNVNIETGAKYTIYVASLTALGVVVAFRQLKSSTDTTRRQLSMTESSRILQCIREKRKELDNYTEMDYTKAIQKKEPIPFDEIHNWICKKCDKTSGYIGLPGNYELSDNGKKIRADIRSIINDYEYIAIGILNGAFDEKIMKDGFKSIVQSTYRAYSLYIDHVRDSEKSPKFAENFEWLATRWKKGNKKTIRDK